MSTTHSALPAHAPSNWLSIAIASCRAHAPLWALLAAYWAANFVIMSYAPGVDKTPSGSGRIALLLGSTYFLAYLVARPIHLALTGNKSPLRALAHDILDLRRFLNGAHVILIFLPFIALFSEIKLAIPHLQPFAWDTAFYQADLAIHGGLLPHEWLSPLLAHPHVMAAINFMYHLWFFVMWAWLLAFAFQREATALRMRYLLAYFSIWVLAGSFTAIAFSSAGPCFYGLLGLSPDPYAGLMHSLREINQTAPLLALNIQAKLWDTYQHGNFDQGISAMPSIHNATSMLFALAAFKINRWLGWALSLFAVIIGIGSVILGWHYAVDAYAGWFLAWLIWKAAGPISRRLTTQGALP